MNKRTLCNEGQYLNKHIVFKSRRGDRLVVIEGVPALVCDVCGDRIITEDTAPKTLPVKSSASQQVRRLIQHLYTIFPQK